MFKPNDHVRMMTEYGYYVYGEITLIGSEGKPKVMWGDPFYSYEYEDPSKLELIKPEDVPKEK